MKLKNKKRWPIDICDQIAYIPITTIESLNVAVAGSIMMYHFQGE